jgi:hypothetical protein
MKGFCRFFKWLRRGDIILLPCAVLPFVLYCTDGRLRAFEVDYAIREERKYAATAVSFL